MSMQERPEPLQKGSTQPLPQFERGHTQPLPESEDPAGVSAIIEPRHMEVVVSQVGDRLRLAEQPGNPERPSRIEVAKERTKAVARKALNAEFEARAARHEARLRGEHISPKASMNMKAIATMIIEMIPGGFGVWGAGDVITALEAIFGRTLDGEHLTTGERFIYLGASAIPIVPARPIVAFTRWAGDRIDEAIYQRSLKKLPPPSIS